MKKWPLRFSLECHGKIWSMTAGHGCPLLLLEIRIDQRRVQYKIINLQTFEVQDVDPPNRIWWSQVVFFTEDVILIQEFDEDRNPDRVKLWMLSIADGGVIWTMEEWRFQGILPQGLIIRNGVGDEKLIDPATGNPSSDTVIGEPLALEIPSHYLSGNEYFSEVSTFLSSTRNVTPIRAIDYYENANMIVFTYYLASEDSLKLYLLGMNHAGQERFFEVLEEELLGIADPTFLINERNVIFVKEKQHFFVYDLAE